jgi:hypothetical protein
VDRSWAGPMSRRPAGQTARRTRFRLSPMTGAARRVPAVSSPATASELSTVAPAPAAAADLIAVVEDSSPQRRHRRQPGLIVYGLLEEAPAHAEEAGEHNGRQ